MKLREGAKFMGEEEIGLLQECFDAILQKHGLNRLSEDADAIASALFKAFGKGVTFRQDLISLADIAVD